MVVKILALGIVVYILYILFFRAKREDVAKKHHFKTSLKDKSETMIECDKCSTFISVKEAFIKNGKYYCSKECMKG